ncbi:MAG: hypothetical protein AAGA85_00050 [Bacteroidota bacterium]
MTISLRYVRLTVRTVILTNVLLFALVYLSLMALLSMQGPHPLPDYLQVRYGQFLPTVSMPVALGSWLGLGLLVLGRWLGISFCLAVVVSLFRHRISLWNILRLLIIAEFVFLFPAWSEIIWLQFIQGDLNILPADSFEPIRILPIAGSVIGAGLDSYWWMYAVWVAVGISRPAQNRPKRLFGCLVTSLLVISLVSRLLWELTLA